MANYTRKPVDFQNEEQDWQKQMKNVSLDLAKGVGKPGEIQKPGFKRQPEYYTTSETAEETQPVTQPDTGSAAPSAGESAAGQDDAVARAQQMLQEHLNQKPGGYQSAWQAQLDEILNQILNRKEFSYDLNGDALYQQYKDQHMMQGQQAMMDTMGQAAALTGGYGNSYAQTVGQQAYQGHIQQLNDRIPELYQLALSKYQMEGDALADQYAMIGARDQQDYGRYQDDLDAYYAELNRLLNERDFAYGQERDQAADEKWEEEFGYQKDRDKAQDEQWQKEFDEAKRRYDQEWEKENGGGSGGIGGGGYTGGPTPTPEAEESVEEEAEEPEEPESQESVPNYDTIAANVNMYIKNGASEKEIKAYLNSAYRAGYITYEQFQSLLKGYRPVDFGE